MEKQDFFELVVPRIGEGLFSVRILELRKRAGDSVKEDEILYALETDKTAVDIESPINGTLLEWLFDEDDVVEVGSVIARLARAAVSIEHAVAPQAQAVKTSSPKPAVAAHLSPRVRNYGIEKGLTIAQLQSIPAKGEFVSTADVDAFISQHNISVTTPAKAHVNSNAGFNESTDQYEIGMLSKQQLWLSSQFRRSQAEVIPASIVGQIDMQRLRAAGKILIDAMGEKDKRYVSEFQILAYILGQSLAAFPLFRAALEHNKQLKIYKHLNLGLAVQADNGDLVTAVVPAVDTLDFAGFDRILKEKISSAIDGRDQATADMSVVLSYMGSGNLLFGAPLLVSPAVATIFFSCPDPIGTAAPAVGYLSITFDHRVLNGMEIARFFDHFSQKIIELSDGAANLSSPMEITRHLSSGEFNALVVQKVESLLNLPPQSVDEQESLGVMGIDSIKALRLKEFIEQTLHIKLASTVLWNYPTIAALTAYCAEKASLPDGAWNGDRGAAKNGSGESVDIESLISELGGLNDDEIALLLRGS